MEKLVQIEYVEKQLKTAFRKGISALYKLIYEEEGGRRKRSKLREFSGFTFTDDSDEFRAKLEYSSFLFVGDLISICNILGLNYSANKEQLRQNIIRSSMDISSLVDRDTEEESGTDDEDDNRRDKTELDNDENSGNGNFDGSVLSGNDDVTRNPRRPKDVKFTLGFKDIEETVSEFDGSESFSIERWFADFEDAAVLFQWSDLEKIVFARRLLKGSAKLFIQSELGLVIWKKLKTVLLKEFATKITSAQLHSMLFRRKIKETESVFEYFLVMREIASRDKIENEALFDYVISGLGDSAGNKAVLFGAKDISDFKDRLKTY